MSAIVQAIAGLAVVIAAAAGAVWVLTRPRLGFLETIAAAPVAGVGLIYLWAEVTDFTGAPFSTASFLVLLGLCAAGAVVLHLTRRAHSTTTNLTEVTAPPEPVVSARPSGVALALLALAIGIGTVMWAASIRSFEAPPNYDAAHHGFFVKRIDVTETTDPDAVLTSGAGQPAVSQFYPLALHGAMALALGPLTSSVPDLLFASLVLFAALAYPVGIFVLTRAMRGGDLAAGFASVVAVLIPLFPYKPLGWGGIALIAGTGMLPAASLVLARTVTRAWTPGTIAFCLFTLLGVFGTHTSQIPVVGLLALAVSLPLQARSDRWSQIVRYSIIVALSGLVLLPTIPRFLSGAADRLVVDDVGTTTLATAAGALVTLSVQTPVGSVPVGVLALAGMALALYRRTMVSLVVFAAGLAGIYAITSTSRGPFTQIASFPWYRQPERIAYHAAVLAAIFAGFAIGAVADSSMNSLRTRARFLVPVPVIAALAIGAVVFPPVARDTIDMVRANNAYYGTVGATEIAAFETLSSVVSPGERVITDMNTDGSMWMYAIAGVEPLFMLQPYTSNESWNERVYLADHIADLRNDPRVQDLVGKYQAGYVYFDESGFGNPPSLLDLYQISLDPAFEPVFDQDGVYVFRIATPADGTPDEPLWSKNLVEDATFDDPTLMRWADPSGELGPWRVESSGGDSRLVLDGAAGEQLLLYQMEPVTWKDPSTRIRTVPAAEGEEYRISVRLGGDPVAGVAFAGLVFFDGEGGYLSQAMAGSADLGSHTTNATATAVVAAPPGTGSAAIAITADGVEGWITLDDFVIQKRLE